MILNFMRGLFYSLLFSHGFKRALIEMFVYYYIFFGKITLNELFLRDSQF
jgi:hypothetical protein